MSDARREPRWRMTFEELCHVSDSSPLTIEHWAQIGAFGPRLRERRDRGAWRHVTRETAQRAVIMRRLVNAGIEEDRAAGIASQHRRGEKGDLLVDTGSVRMRVNREGLP